MVVLLFICEKADTFDTIDKAKDIVDFQRVLAIFQTITALYMIFVSVVTSPHKSLDAWWYDVTPWVSAVFAVLDFVIIPIIIMI